MIRVLFPIICLSFAGGAILAADVSSPRHEVVAADKGKIFRFDQHGNVVWTFDQFDRFGNSVSNSQLLDVQGDVLR